ncbi:MAG: ATP-binding cassette domain-containing protein [Acidobacteriota bacterium]|nr:ATP-binding cassette domain-containing protein [Blastocatellia bacterium]MDW8411187.1 ATP-binding cassette domain-containing protein [Acidobacteriota bacterium]
MASYEDCVAGPLEGHVERREALLKLERVTQSFRMNNGVELVVLKELDLEIIDIKFKPQIVSLLGPSGSGKTTALRIIAGLDKPKFGQVLIGDGEQGSLRRVRAGDVGVVFQRYPLFDDLRVVDNLVEPAVRIGKMSRKEALDQALQYLDRFNLVRQGYSWPVQLSGGQRQRVAILQQLITGKKFIVLDEPFSGLDPISVSNAIQLISEIAHQHTLNTFIIVTHDVSAALLISDHVYLLGRERDEKGNPLPGARVVKVYDLIAEGIAYRDNMEDLPRYRELYKQICRKDFPLL